MRQTCGVTATVDAGNRIAQRAASVIVIGLALVSSACLVGGSSGTTSSTSVPSTIPGGNPPSPIAVSGSVTAGPTCPVERLGHPCPPAPVHGTVLATDTGGAQAASAVTDAAGNYAFVLLPGGYTFVVIDTGGTRPRCPSTPVTVSPGPPLQVDIACDTGIR